MDEVKVSPILRAIEDIPDDRLAGVFSALRVELSNRELMDYDRENDKLYKHLNEAEAILADRIAYKEGLNIKKGYHV